MRCVEGGSGGEDGGAHPDAPAAGSDGDVPDMDDEEMNARVLQELELARQGREQHQQQEQAPQNDPPPDNGTSPIASSGGPALTPGRAPPCGATGTNPTTIHRPSDAGGHRWFQHPLIDAVIPPRDAPERDEATQATPAEATPEDEYPTAAARRRCAASQRCRTW